MKNYVLFFLISTLISCGNTFKSRSFVSNINQGSDKNFVTLRTEGRNGHSDYSVFKDYSTGKTYAVNVAAYKDSGLSALNFFNSNLGNDLVVEIVEVSNHTEYNPVAYTYTFHTYENQLIDGIETRVKVPHTGYGTTQVPKTITDYHGSNGMIFDETNSSSKDLEKLAANIEGKDTAELAINIEEKFGFSTERAQKIASLQLAFNKLKSKRSLTISDQDIFTKKLIGVDFKTAKNAFKNHIQGDSADMENILERAAGLNGTSPEHMTELLGEILL